NSRVRLLALSSVIILTIAGCGVTQTSDRTSKAASSRDNDPQGLLRKSQRSAPDEAARMRINAAEAFRASGDTQQAAAALEGIDPARLDASNKFAYYNTRALTAIDARNYSEARQALSLAIPTDAASRNSLALTVADLAEAELRFED